MRRAAIAVAVLAALAACTSREPRRNPAHDGPRVGGRLVIGLDAEPRNLDSTTQFLIVEDHVLSFIGASLVALSPEGKLVPWLATDWTVEPDGKRVTFHLRRGVRFHSGKPLVAADYQATFDRILDPATRSPGRDSLAGVTAVRAVDDSTLVFDLNRPNYALLFSLATNAWSQPVDPAALARWGSEYGKHPSSVGPYRLKEMHAGGSIILERNPDYRWAPPFVHQGPWYFQEIEFRTLPEPAARVAAFETGEVTLLRDVGAPNWARLAKSPSARFFETRGYAVQFLEYNLDRPFFADVRVRRALQHALDRQAIVDAAWEGHGTPGYGAVHRLLVGYLPEVENPPLARHHDPAAARRLLEEAGWRDGDHDGVREREAVRMKLRLYADGPRRVEAELVQAQLREVGIEAVIETFETSTMFDRIQRGDYDLALDGFGWVGDAGDAMSLFLHSSQVGTGMNFERYRSPEMDELLRRAREATSESDHLRALADAQRLFARDAVWATIGYPRRGIALRRSIRGARLHPHLQELILADAWLAEGE